MKNSVLILLIASLGLSACTQSSNNPEKKHLDGAYQHNQDPDKKEVQADLPGAEIAKLYHAVGKDLSTTMLQCPDKIWPNYNWKKMNVLMLRKDAPSMIWVGEKGAIEPLADSEIPAGAKNGLYSFFKWKGQDAVSIFLEDGNSSFFQDQSVLTKLIVHEGFHYHGQQNWIKRDGQRGTAYPLPSSPRIMRRLMADKLKTYLFSSGTDKQALGQAAYWFQKWSQEFPAEVQSTTDGYEGTARYVDLMANIIVQTDCHVSDEALLKAAIPAVEKDSQFQLNSYNLRLDSEGYALGALSSTILRLVDRNQAWYERAEKGETPLEILLKDLEAIPDSVVPSLEAEYSMSAQKQNDALGKMFGNDLLLFPNPETIRIVIPSKAAVASYSPKGFFLPQSMPGMTVMPLRSDYLFETSAWKLAAKAEINLFRGSNPCPLGSFIALAEPKDVQSTDTRIKVSAAKLKGVIKGNWTQDSNGLNWFCGQ